MCLVSGWIHQASGRNQILDHLGSTISAHLLLSLSVLFLKLTLVFDGFLR